MDSLHRHKSLYKGTTPPWKETYRKRCMERMKNSRSRLLEKYRQVGEGHGAPTRSFLVQEVMEEEWTALHAADRNLPPLWARNSVADLFGVMDDEHSVLEEIQRELLAQELSIIDEYEKSVRYEEQCLNAMVDVMVQDDRIICPICHANNLTVNSHLTSCSCGLYINTMGRNVTPDILRKLLEKTVTEHMEECLYNPVFSMGLSTDGSPSLMISCRVCDYLSVVL
ncbi:RPA-interacting protein isoform X2 [Denticeps clupeoides]|uniref:RPA-interacting protein n=1 Tax=Denticeps clupeoides TaxID=299321 RepID=A0AAY4E6W0_9TELE|nr:RPA-interacting protein isoform X2 [Denticeps clupeoides]